MESQDDRIIQSLQMGSECYQDGASPEEHISAIRSILFGIGSDVPKNDHHANTQNQAIARLAMTAHSSPFHFICELMQNVSDAQSRLKQLDLTSLTYLDIVLSHIDPFKKDSEGFEERRKFMSQKRTFSSSISEDENETGGILLLSYNELGWTNSDVEAIVKARESTKKAKDCEFIGEKGQGFYSVFRIATEAIILSGQLHKMDLKNQKLIPSSKGNNILTTLNHDRCNKIQYPIGGYFFKLGRDACQDCGFKYVVPKWISPEQIPFTISHRACGRSALCLRIGCIPRLDVRDNIHQENNSPLAVMMDLRKTLLRFPKESLLFLQNPEVLRLSVPLPNGGWRKLTLKREFLIDGGISLDTDLSINAREIKVLESVEDFIEGDPLMHLRDSLEYQPEWLGHTESLTCDDEQPNFLKISHSFSLDSSVVEKTISRHAAKQRHIDMVFPLVSRVPEIDDISSDEDYDTNDRNYHKDSRRKDCIRWSLFVCLPVDEENTGLPAVVNGDWLLTANREQLAMDEHSKTWNMFLIKQLPLSYVKALMYLSRSRWFFEFAQFIPRVDASPTQAFELIPTKTILQLSRLQVIPLGWSGSCSIEYCKPKEALLFDIEILQLAAQICGNDFIGQFCIKHRLVHCDVLLSSSSITKTKDSIQRLIGCGVMHFTMLSVNQFSKIIGELITSEKFIKNSLNANTMWWEKLLRSLTLMILLYSSEFQTLINKMILKSENESEIIKSKVKCEDIAVLSMKQIQMLKELELRCVEAARLQHIKLSSTEFASDENDKHNSGNKDQFPRRSKKGTNKRIGATPDQWDEVSPLTPEFFTSEQHLLMQILRDSLSLPLWNGKACKASEGFLNILLEKSKVRNTSISSPMNSESILLGRESNELDDNANESLTVYEVLHSALAVFDSMNVDREKLSPKFVHPRCWQFNSVSSITDNAIPHYIDDDVTMCDDLETVHPTSTKSVTVHHSTTSSLPIQVPPILHHIFDVTLFNLNDQILLISKTLSNPKFLHPTSNTKDLSVEANARLFWSLVNLTENSYDNTQQNTPTPSDPAIISSLFNQFPRLLQCSSDSINFIGELHSIKINGLRIAPPNVAVMIPQSIGTWSRLLVPFGVDGVTHWIGRYVLSEVYVKFKPWQMSINDCRLKLLRYLSAVDFPDFGPPIFQRQAVCLRITEHEFPRSLQPAPNPTKLSQIFELNDFHIQTNSLELFTKAVSELHQLKDLSETFIEDIPAPDWIKLQHPCFRVLWDESFNGYGNIIKPLSSSMGINVSRWKLPQSTINTMRKSIDDSQNFELFVKWIESNYRNLGIAQYGGVEGSIRAPVLYSFESQLRYFLVHCLWLPVCPLGSQGLGTTTIRSNKLGATIMSQHLDKACPLGLLYIDPNNNHHTNLFQLVRRGCSHDSNSLLCLTSTTMKQLGRSISQQIGIISEVGPQSAFNTIRLLQSAHEKVLQYIALCRNLSSYRVDHEGDLTLERRNNEGNSTLSAVHCFLYFLDWWHLIGYSARIGRLGIIVSLLYMMLNKSGPLIADQIVNEVSRHFSIRSLLYVPCNSGESYQYEFITLEDIERNIGHWRTKNKVIWEIEEDVLEAMNLQSLNGKKEAPSSKLGMSQLSDTWISINLEFSDRWKDLFQDFFLNTVGIPKRPDLTVFLLGLRDLRDRLSDGISANENEISLLSSSEESAFDEIASSGVSSFRMLFDCIADKWASTVEQVSVVSDAFRQDPVVIVQQFYLEDSSIPSSFKSRYYIAPPEFTFFVPCPIDIQHPAVENIRPELSRLFDSRIPIIVQPKITDRGAPRQTAFESLCRAIAVPSVHIYLTTTIIPKPLPISDCSRLQESEVLNEPKRQLNPTFFPLFLRTLMRTMIISLYEVFPQMARALQKRDTFPSLVNCGFKAESEPFLCRYTFEFTLACQNRNGSQSDQEFIPRWRFPLKTNRTVTLTTTSENSDRPYSSVRFIRTPTYISVVNDDDAPDQCIEGDENEEIDHGMNGLDEGVQAMNRRLRKLERNRKKLFSFGRKMVETDSEAIHLPSEKIRKPAETFDLEFHIDENLLSNREDELQNEDESILLNSGADRLVAEAAMYLVDELCDLNPSSRCHLFQRFRSCLTPFIDPTSMTAAMTDSEIPRKVMVESESLIQTTLSEDLIEWIERLFEGRPRQKRVATRHEIPRILATLGEVKQKEEDISSLMHRAETQCQWNAAVPQMDAKTQTAGNVHECAKLTSVVCTGNSKISVSWWKDSALPGIKVDLYCVCPNDVRKRERRRKRNIDSDDDECMDPPLKGFTNANKKCSVDINHNKGQLLLSSKTTMSSDIESIVFEGVYHMHRYLVELWAKEDDESQVVVDHCYFDCPLPQPEWCCSNEQSRLGRGIKLAWKPLPVPAIFQIAIGTGGWSGGPYYSFNPNDVVLHECDKVGDDSDVISIEFEVPIEYESLPLHFKMRAYPISGSYTMRRALVSETSAIMSMLPYGFCVIQRPPIQVGRNDVIEIPDEGKVSNGENADFEDLVLENQLEPLPTKQLTAVMDVLESTAAPCCFPEQNVVERTSCKPVDGSHLRQGCFVLLRRNVWDYCNAVVARVERVRLTSTGGKIVVNRKYVPGRYTNFLKLDLGDGNPLELFLYGDPENIDRNGENEDESHLIIGTKSSVDIEDVVAIVHVKHALPNVKVPLIDDIEQFYEDGAFLYDRYCTTLEGSQGSLCVAVFHCRYMVTCAIQKYHPGGLSRSDIDIHRLPRALLSESDCQLLENLMAQFKCGTEEFKMSAADLFAGGGGTSEGLTLAGYNVHWACEKDHYACQTWSRNHPKGKMFEKCVMELLRDIREGRNGVPSPFGVRLLCGSSPCQGFSSINVRGGALDLANRSLIFAVQQFVDVLQPQYCMFENVVGMMSTDRNKVTDFQQFLMLLLDIGYTIRTKVLNALDYGSPSERHRVLLIATHFAQVPPEWPKPFTPAPKFASIRQAIYKLPRFAAAESGHSTWSVDGDLAVHPEEETNKEVAEGRLANGVYHHARSVPPLHLYCHNTTFRNHRLARRLLPDDHFSAFLANILQCLSTHPDIFQGRVISLREVLRGMTFPDTFIADYGFDADFYKQVGNSVPPVLSFVLASMIKQCSKQRSNCLI